MGNKILSFFIRSIISIGIAYILAFITFGIVKSDTIAVSVLIVTAFLGIVFYAIRNFNTPIFRFSAIETVEKSAERMFDKRKQRTIEEDMLRTKELFDSGILTEDEYNTKIAKLKKDFL